MTEAAKVVIDPKQGKPKRYINRDSGQLVYKDPKTGEEVVVTPLHSVDDEVTVQGRIIAVGDGSDGNEYVDVAVKALTSSTVPTLQYQVVRMDSDNATVVVPGTEVRAREEKARKEAEEKAAKEKKEAEEKAAKELVGAKK
jgi:hypothetical protein